MSADLLTRLIEAGTPAALIAEVALLAARADASVEALEGRRRADRERQSARRHAMSRDVTGHSVTQRDVTDNLPLDKEIPPKPPKEINPPTPNEPDGSLPPAGAGAAKSKPRVRKGKTAGRGSRLGDDWQAPPVAELSERVRRTVAEWPRGAYEHVAEMFRNHFLAEGRAVGSKRDWSKAWSNWLLREHSTILRQVKAGVRFEPPAAATTPRSAEELAGEQAAVEHLAELRLAEGAGAAKVRSILKRTMGVTLYGQWLENTAMGLSGDTLIVSVHSEFLRGWIEQHHAERISGAAREVLGRQVEVVCRLVHPPPDAVPGEDIEERAMVRA